MGGIDSGSFRVFSRVLTFKNGSTCPRLLEPLARHHAKARKNRPMTGTEAQSSAPVGTAFHRSTVPPFPPSISFASGECRPSARSDRETSSGQDRHLPKLFRDD